ncbi:hypothetical protein CPB97_004727, partial [Podila verticillata]
MVATCQIISPDIFHEWALLSRNHPPKNQACYVNLDAIPTNNAPSSLSKHDLHKRYLEEARFVSNKVVTIQYSIFTFIPKNLYHQFRRVANFFFLVIVILQCIEPFQSMEPVVSALPLMIIVGLTAARDGFEDWKRHEVDQTVNHRKTLGLHNWRNITMEHKLAHHHHRRHRAKYAQYMPLDTDHTSKRSWVQYALAWALWSKIRWRSVLKMCKKGCRRICRTMGDRRRSTQPIHAGANSHETEEPESTPPVIGFKYRYLQQSRETVDNNQHPAGELYELTESPPNGDISQPYWRPRLWQDVYEGDLVLLQKNDFMPADLLILSSSEQEPIGYVETMNLDGETNLKIRQCVPGLSDLCTPEECAQKRFWVESEGPTNNLLNTINLVVMAVICSFIAFMSRGWESHFQNVGAPFITNESSSSYHSAAYSSFVSFMMSVITFQNLVPAYFIFQDLELYCKERSVPCMPCSWNLSDDLGQIEYIFSDKTGTLTTNQMEFKKCTIQGINGSRKADSEQDQSFTQHPIQGNKDRWHDHTMDMEILDDSTVFQENKDPEFEHFHPGEQPRRRSRHNTLVNMDGVLTSSGLRIVSMNESESPGDSHSRDLLQADSALQPGQRKSRSRSSSMATAALIEPIALASTQSSNDQSSQHRYEFGDQKTISKDDVSDPQPSGSSSLYKKWDPVNSAFAKPFRRSINSVRKREAQLQPREGQNTALVIDGLALKFTLEDLICEDFLLELACRCTAVICCRVSPLQKAMVVKMVKDAKQVMTLSIGDGANDVSMIQEAHIGVGVAGEEGLQAVMASDYSIGQFRFLTRLLLVHGHYAYLRNTSMVMLFIFKNIMGIGALFCFEFLCGYSPVPPFEYSLILLYNVVLTVFPPLIIGIFDRDIGPVIEGAFQSIVCFIVPYYAYRYGTVNDSGRVQEMYEMGLAMAVSSIVQVNIFAAVVSQAFCVYHVIFIWGSVALIFVYSAMYTLLPKALSQMNPNYGFSRTVMGSATFWAVVVLTLVICNLPRLTARYIRRMWAPKDLDILQEICHLEHMNKHTMAPMDSTSVMDATSVTDDNARGSILLSGKHIRLDWTWGIVPSSAPSNKKRSAANSASLSDDMSIRSSTTASFTDPSASREDQTRLPGLPELPIALSPIAPQTVTPCMAQIDIPASRSPSPHKYPASIHSCDSARISASPRIMSTLISVPSPSRCSLRRFKGTEVQSSLSGSGAVLHCWTGEMVETEDDNGAVMDISEESNPGLRKVPRSAFPTFVASSPPAQISVSDPLSLQSSTPILGFGFAQ